MNDAQPVKQAPGEPYRPERIYLSASNWFFLALKVTGYALIGSLVISVPVWVIAVILLNLNGGHAIPVP